MLWIYSAPIIFDNDDDDDDNDDINWRYFSRAGDSQAGVTGDRNTARSTTRGKKS